MAANNSKRKVNGKEETKQNLAKKLKQEDNKDSKDSEDSEDSDTNQLILVLLLIPNQINYLFLNTN